MALAEVIIRSRRVECDCKSPGFHWAARAEEIPSICASTHTTHNVVAIGIIPPPEDCFASEDVEEPRGGVESPSDNIVRGNIGVYHDRVYHVNNATHPRVQLREVLKATRGIEAIRKLSR